MNINPNVSPEELRKALSLHFKALGKKGGAVRAKKYKKEQLSMWGGMKHGKKK